MKYGKKLLLLMAVSLMASVSMAQSISPVDFMRYNPRNVFANPAFFTPQFGYFDLALGGVNISSQNTGIKYRRFFQFNSDGKPVVLDLNQGLAAMKKNNYVNTFVNYDVFNCGRVTKHGYFTFSHRFREMGSVRFNKDLLGLLFTGNGSYMGEDNPAKADLALAVRAYQEFNFGYQMCLTEKLNIGARFKFLMGFADAKSKAASFQLVTDPETYAMRASGDVDMRLTMPYQMTLEHGLLHVGSTRFDIANLFKNYGAGIDLGAEYQINDQIGVAAAINDLGFIRWNNYSFQINGGVEDAGPFYDNGSFVFNGLTTEQLEGILDDPSYLKKYGDTLMRYFDLNAVGLKGYTSGLNTTMMVRGYYDLTPEHRFSAQLTGYASGIGFRPAMTLAYTGSFAEKYDVVATYTMMKGSFANVGVGLSADFDGILMYVATTNIFGFFNPSNANLNLQFGISFTGGGRSSRDERIVLRQESVEEEPENIEGGQEGVEVEQEGVEVE